MRVCEKGKFLQINFYKIKTEEFVRTKKMVLIRQFHISEFLRNSEMLGDV